HVRRVRTRPTHTGGRTAQHRGGAGEGQRGDEGGAPAPPGLGAQLHRQRRRPRPPARRHREPGGGRRRLRRPRRRRRAQVLRRGRGDGGMQRPSAYVAGTGRGIPAKVMTNYDFAALGLDTSHEWIFERTGIVGRRIACADETTCSMAVTAARQAMAKAGVQAGELDAIVLSTATPDRLLPSTAVALQAELGATRAAAFDLSAACTGWIYGMTVAEGMIQ